MNSVHLRARAAVFFALFTAAAWLALLSCSSDPTSTLGSDSDLLGSEPGAVYEDTIGVLDDTTQGLCLAQRNCTRCAKVREKNPLQL